MFPIRKIYFFKMFPVRKIFFYKMFPERRMTPANCFALKNIYLLIGIFMPAEIVSAALLCRLLMRNFPIFKVKKGDNRSSG